MAELVARGSLPHGWQVRVSKRYPDRIYYFNIFTGSSTWECPELDLPREKEVSKDGTDGSTVEVKNILEAASCKLRLQKASKEISVVSKTSKKDTIDHHNSNSYPTSDDIVKMCAPPTAVVVPVIHKRNIQANSSQINKPCLDLQVVSSIQSKRDTDIEKLKRKSDSLHEDTSNKSKKIKKKSAKKKKKISPLNKSDSELEPNLKCKKDKKLKKGWDNSSSLDVDALVKCENDLSENTVENKEAEDIEMLDVSMDIIDEITAKEETVVDAFASYYIVVDTNVLISELHLINELKDTPVNGCGPPHIFIPWVVIEELDKLKSNRNVKTTMRAACEAIRYLNSVLGKHPRFHGQSPAEAENWAKTYSKCNDDRLLECCLALGDKMNPEKVILLTNDKNLVNKALICSINVHNWKSMMKSVKPDVVFNLKKNKAKEDNKAESTNESSKLTDDEEQMIISQRNIYKREIHTVMCTARQLLKNVVSEFVEDEMLIAYGPKWVLFPIQRKLLEGMLLAVTTYWQMVFSEILNEKDKRNFELLYKTATRPEGFLADKEECLLILSTIEDVFRQIKKKRPKINVPVEQIEEFRIACVDTFHTYCKLENTIKEAEQIRTLAVFERNWSAINQLCGMVLDFCKITHDVEYDKPSEVPTEPEFRRLICNLYPGVQQLKTLMFNILDSLRNDRAIKKTVHKLYTALISFIPSLEIPCDPVSYPHFSAQMLEKFCVCPQNREMIEIGYKQIAKFYSKLDEALSALMSAKFEKRSMSPETMICD